MRICKLLSVAFAVTLIQCNSPKEKFNKGDYSGEYSIRDLITEVPALDEKNIAPVILEDAALKAVFDKNSGRLVSLVSKRTGWHIQQRGYLSRSFRLAVPLPGRRDNCVYGERQAPCKVEISNDNKKVAFTWANLTSECDKNLDIRFVGVVELTDGGLQFTARVDNKLTLYR